MTDSIRGWAATGRMDVSTEIDDAVERIAVSIFHDVSGVMLRVVRAELLAAEQRGAAAVSAKIAEPSATGENQYLCKHGHVHQGKGYAVSCLGDFRPSATAQRARDEEKK